MAYAEKIYAQIDELGQLAAFSQETIYLRAFNLEKMGAYQEALKFYSEIVKTSASNHYEEAAYKIGMINAYCLADAGQAQKSFEILAALPVASPHMLSSLYQLGLLAQWQADTVKAGGYYELLLQKAQNKNAEIVAQVSARLKEIRENQPLNYNLKMFLDLSLKNGSKLLEMNKAELKPAKYILEKNEKNTVSALVSMPQSGCNQVDLPYLWSGDLGGATPSATQSNFEGAYADAGTKDISIVIISPAGAIDRYFMMVDVY
jgi:tetratricopeptide (TPR) repeat protein